MLVIKPDGMVREVHRRVRDLTAAESLEVVATRRIRVSEEILRDLYPKHLHHPLSHAFLREYLLGKQVEMRLLRGDRAVYRGRRLRDLVRAEFGRHDFCNVIHAPDDSEVCEQLEIFFPEHGPFPGVCSTVDAGDVDSGEIPYDWPLPLEPLAKETLKQVTADRPRRLGAARIRLDEDTLSSMDARVAALMHCLTGIGFREATMLALKITTGNAEIAWEWTHDVDALARSLRESGLTACVERAGALPGGTAL